MCLKLLTSCHCGSHPLPRQAKVAFVIKITQTLAAPKLEYIAQRGRDSYSLCALLGEGVQSARRVRRVERLQSTKAQSIVRARSCSLEWTLFRCHPGINEMTV